MSTHAASIPGADGDVLDRPVDRSHEDAPEVLLTDREVTEKVASITEKKMPRWWLPALLASAGLAGVSILAIVYLVATGVGVWGLNQPIGWAWDITNFVFWIGIGHAGTLISAILFLFRQRWRTPINRAAEAMTIFAVSCAGLFPLIHVGRIWRIYFTAPVPNHLDLWPNFKSPLLWDVFAVSTYATVSILFFYVGLMPDFATMRDRAKGRLKAMIFGFLALGWRGGQRQWRHYEMAYLLLAGLATPLVLSVHSIVSFDFAVSQIPGWHTTIFPPYFVAGAVLGGFAMVLIMLIPVRSIFGLQQLISERVLDNMCKVVLATGSIVGFAYLTEIFIAWYSGSPYEQFTFFNVRISGSFAGAFVLMVICNVIAPQFFWFKRFRRSLKAMFIIAVLVTIGMWFERFVIIVSSLSQDALPSSWGDYAPTWVEIATFAGTFGLFLTLYLLFLRFLPVVAISEVKGANAAERHERGEHHAAVATDDVDATLPRREEGAPAPFGVIASFPDGDALKSGAAAVHEAGYQRFDAHSPYPIHGMRRAMGEKRSPLGWFTLAGAGAGALVGFLLQYYPSVIEYPLIVGGKVPDSWPAFIPITFELSILLGAFATIIGMFVLSKQPRLYHPVHEHEAFARASDDAFFLVIEADDDEFDPQRTARLLARAGGRDVQWLEA